MKIRILLFCISCSFSCSPTSENKSDAGNDSLSDTEFIPENCQQYDGDKAACANAGCNVYNETPIWCVKQGECLIDKRPHGFCAHVPPDEYSLAGWGNFRLDLGIATEFAVPPQGITDWKSCFEDETGPPECQCYQKTGFKAVEGECL